MLKSYYPGTTNLDDVPNGFNIFREINETDSRAQNFHATVVATANYRFTDNLSFDGLASVEWVNNESENINGKNTYAAWIDRPFDLVKNLLSKRIYGSIMQSNASNQNYLLRGQLNFSKQFGDYHMSALAGSEIRRQFAKNIFAKRYGYDPVSGKHATPSFPSQDKFSDSDLILYASIVDGLSGQAVSEDAFASFYFSSDYSYLNRYIFSLTARTDGSNNFGAKDQFNPTGSVGLAWNVDQETFMERMQPWISSLSLRIAGGYTGNVNRSVYPQLVMSYLSSFRKSDTDSYRQGYIRNAPNPSLRWEKTRDAKFSLDLGLLDERIHFNLELYDRLTTDAVSAIPIVTSTGFDTQSYNTSEIKNQGIEATINLIPVKTDDWRVSLGVNMAYNSNMLVKYDVVNPNYAGYNHVGYPLNSLFAGKVEGIDKNLGIYTYVPRPDAVFETPEDRRDADKYLFYLGTTTPIINGGYSLNVSYKSLSLSVAGSYSAKGFVFNQIEPQTSYSNLSGRGGDREPIPNRVNDLYSYHLNASREMFHRWTPSNPVIDGMPRIIDAFGERLYLDDYMVTSSRITRTSTLENISYFKIGSLVLGYNFMGDWLKKLKLKNLSLSAIANNVLIVSNYSGIDPETPGAVYPIPRSYSLSLSVGF